MNLDRAFPGQQKFWEGKDFDVLKYALLSPYFEVAEAC